MSNYIFEMKNLSYQVTDGRLNQINLNVQNNEIHALIIKNRSEQNVFMSLLDNFHHIIEKDGKIIFKGKSITETNKHEIAIIQQHPQLIENFSVVENINFTTIPTYRFFPFINWRKMRSRTKSLLKELNFDINLNTRVCYLSLDEKKATYLARFFMEKPDLMIMQEPTEGLSLYHSALLYKLIKQYQADGGSVLYITKQWEEALRISDRISIFSQGEIIEEVQAEHAIKDPRLLLSKLNDYDFKEKLDFENNEQLNVLEAVFKAAELLSSEYELEDVLLLLAKEVTNVMHADGCTIQLIDEITGSNINNFEIKNNTNMKVCLTQETIDRISKRNNIFYANENDKVFYTLFKEIKNVKTYIAVPVLIRKQVTAIIQIYYENLYVHSNKESKYLSTLARQAAIAIEDTRLLGRSAFLQESHHRIKNNLQSIVGLITLQKAFVKNNPDISIDDLLDNIISRIRSIAAVHQLLSKEKLGRSIINVKELITAVIDIINNNPNITIHLELEDILIPYNKATSIALIINELVINCFKHAFNEGEKGDIRITCTRLNEVIFLSVSDNGKGFQIDFNIQQQDSLGLSIIRGIVDNDFKGTIEFKGEKRNKIEIYLPSKNIFNNK